MCGGAESRTETTMKTMTMVVVAATAAPGRNRVPSSLCKALSLRYATGCQPELSWGVALTPPNPPTT